MYPQQSSDVSELLSAFIAEEKLPAHYLEDAEKWFLPLLDTLVSQQQDKTGALFVGLNGAQGTGKSTLAALLTALLQAQGFTVANLSIDDFYLSKQARSKLAATTHPLLASRGVPGTHDTDLLATTLAQLRDAGPADQIALPRFDKSMDDCCPPAQWPRITGPVDFIILEGWCVGLQAEEDASLATASNALEAQEDAEGRWRRFVNEALRQDYQELFGQLDRLIMLRAPSFDQVYEWRSLQEEKLRARSVSGASGLMDETSLKRFIQHFERLTRHCLATLGAQADQVFILDTDHRVVASEPE